MVRGQVILLGACLIAVPARGLELEWVYVPAPGNAADTEVMSCCGPSTGTAGYGAVPYAFWISKHEITNTQYVEFLNAVARSDPKKLFSQDMQEDPQFGGITARGSPANRHYMVKPGFENKPVGSVTFYDALRFANWLHNGQPQGAQRPDTTEDGAYTITQRAIEKGTIGRNAGALFFLTSEDEWYKAAYYDPSSGQYFDYPTGTDTAPACVAPDADTGNAANYCLWGAELTFTEVGAYALSPSAVGTFDQAGNALEWNESIVLRALDDDCGDAQALPGDPVRVCRGLRGGHLGDGSPVGLAASYRGDADPTLEYVGLGFRVATVVPEPGRGVLAFTGVLVLVALRKLCARATPGCLPLVASALLLAPPARAVTVDWVTVEDPGNAYDTEVMTDGTTDFGSVDYVYRIGKYEVTNAQYAEFLNAVAASDPNGLYDPRMGSDDGLGGIVRDGSEGSFTYEVKPGFERKPVDFVSFYDALRFVNWLHYRQPVGAQGPDTTEDGAYTITEHGIRTNTILRNPGARRFLPSEDEWYKAAYYDPSSGQYFDYPTGTNTKPRCELPLGNTRNRANCWPASSPDGALTDVGSYHDSPSPAGTFDQGGNLFEWTEGGGDGEGRVPRGGAWISPARFMAASYRAFDVGGLEDGGDLFGFRVASPAPEPGQALLAATGLLVLLVARRRSA